MKYLRRWPCRSVCVPKNVLPSSGPFWIPPSLCPSHQAHQALLRLNSLCVAACLQNRIGYAQIWFARKGWFPHRAREQGRAEQTYVDIQDRQVGSVADQQLPLPRNFSHTHLRHSALTYLNLPSNLTPLSVFSHPSISLRENIGRMRYETRSWYGRMS